MSSTSTPAPDGHPIVAFTHRLHRVLDTLSDTPTWSMTPAEHRAVLVGLARAGSRVEGLRLTVLAGADRADVAAETAATSTAAWVAHATRQPRAAAHADLHLAQALDTDHPTTRAALGAGTLDPAQARVIISALRALPDTVTPTDRARAEDHLITLAGAHDAKQLRILGRRILEVLDPDAADEQEGRALEAEETTAARRTYLHIRDNHDGTHSGRFRIPDLHAAMLTTMLNALTSPAQYATGTSTLHPHPHPHPAIPAATPATRIPPAPAIPADPPPATRSAPHRRPHRPPVRPPRHRHRHPTGTPTAGTDSQSGDPTAAASGTSTDSHRRRAPPAQPSSSDDRHGTSTGHDRTATPTTSLAAPAASPASRPGSRPGGRVTASPATSQATSPTPERSGPRRPGSRGPSCWARPCAPCSNGSPPTGSPPPPACRPPWSCSSTTTSCSPDSAPPTCPPATPSPRPRPAASPAKPGSSPSSTNAPSAAPR